MSSSRRLAAGDDLRLTALGQGRITKQDADFAEITV